MIVQVQLSKRVTYSDGQLQLQVWVSGTENIESELFLVRQITAIPGGLAPGKVFVRTCVLSDLYNYPANSIDTVRSHYRVSGLNLLFTSRVTLEAFWSNLKTEVSALVTELTAVADAPAVTSTLLEL